jgi:uncharacterized protein YaiI (UPF0178 family)
VNIHIWIDADSCPRIIRDYIIEYADKLHIPVVFAANRNIIPVKKTQFFSMIICENKPGAADDYISEHATCSDIVVTRDIPLAARLVEKKITVLNDRGTVYTSENIRERLSERDFNLQLAQIGVIQDGMHSYSKKQFSLFANCFDREIHQLIKKSI